MAKKAEKERLKEEKKAARKAGREKSKLEKQEAKSPEIVNTAAAPAFASASEPAPKTSSKELMASNQKEKPKPGKKMEETGSGPKKQTR